MDMARFGPSIPKPARESGNSRCLTTPKAEYSPPHRTSSFREEETETSSDWTCEMGAAYEVGLGGTIANGPITYSAMAAIVAVAGQGARYAFALPKRERLEGIF